LTGGLSNVYAWLSKYWYVIVGVVVAVIALIVYLNAKGGGGNMSVLPPV
jgi:type II secretory pathway component PulF